VVSHVKDGGLPQLSLETSSSPPRAVSDRRGSRPDPMEQLNASRDARATPLWGTVIWLWRDRTGYGGIWMDEERVVLPMTCFGVYAGAYRYRLRRLRKCGV